MLRDRNVSEAENRKLVVSLRRKRIQCTLKFQKEVRKDGTNCLGQPQGHREDGRVGSGLHRAPGSQTAGAGGSDDFRVDHRRTLNGRGTYGQERESLGTPGAQSLRRLWRCSRPAFTASTNRDVEKSTSDIAGA